MVLFMSVVINDVLILEFFPIQMNTGHKDPVYEFKWCSKLLTSG
jgi:hypothetical protein